jgi:hypothetical protein
MSSSIKNKTRPFAAFAPLFLADDTPLSAFSSTVIFLFTGTLDNATPSFTTIISASNPWIEFTAFSNDSIRISFLFLVGIIIEISKVAIVIIYSPLI